jgi:hypothetical protein
LYNNEKHHAHFHQPFFKASFILLLLESHPCSKRQLITYGIGIYRAGIFSKHEYEIQGPCICKIELCYVKNKAPTWVTSGTEVGRLSVFRSAARQFSRQLLSPD